MIKQYIKNLVYVVGIGLALYLSLALFTWAELESAPLGLIILYSLLGWALRYGLALASLAVFLTTAIPSRYNLPCGLRQLVFLLFISLLLPALLLFSGKILGQRVDRVASVLPRYRAHSVVRTFAPGRFFRGEGIMFRPGGLSTNGYDRSLFLLSDSGGGALYVDSAVIVEEKRLQIIGGWRIDTSLQTNSVAAVPFSPAGLFVTPPIHQALEGFDPVAGATRFFGWRIYPLAPEGLRVLLEAGFFAIGLILLMAGAGLFVRREPMSIGRRFLAVVLWVLIAAGPVFLIQQGYAKTIARSATPAGMVYLMRGVGFLLLGLVVLVLGWRRYRRSLPPEVGGSL